MNNKFYVGNKASSFEAYNEIGPITGVSLLVDDETEYIAGTKNGFVLEVNCAYGTQQIANDILAKVNGKTYKGYRAEGAELDPAAELGDGITIRGLYSMLAYRSASFGPEHMSEISAPGESELDHEYPYITQTERKIRQSQATVSDWLKQQDVDLRAAIDSATQQITGANGGNIVFRYNEQGQPYEMLILDTDDINTAKNVWRWNSGGWGHSSNGYGGPYTLAATQDGAINADLITTGTLVATLIKTGILQSKDGETFYLDLDKGELRMNATEFTIAGKSVNEALSDSVTSIVQQYYQSSSPTSLSDGKWQNTQPTWAQGKYIWNRQYVTYGDDHHAYLPSETGVCITGNTGANGTNGTNGTNGKDGAPGANGTNGIGVNSIVAEYYISNSATAPSGGSWSTTFPTVQSGKYIWFHQKITYSDGNIKYAGEYCMTKTVGDIAQQKVDAQTQEQIFDKLTNHGALQGLYMQDGQLYVNASYIKTGELLADLIKTGKISSKNGLVYFDLDNNELACSRLIDPNPNSKNKARISVSTDGFSGTLPPGTDATINFASTNQENYNGLVFALGAKGINGSIGNRLMTNVEFSITDFVGFPVFIADPTNQTVDMGWGGVRDFHIGPGEVRVNGTAEFYATLAEINFLTVSGSKSRVVSTEDFNRRLLYSYETPHPMFGDIGSGQTDENGECHVSINPIFSETIADMEYYVFLQKEGDGDLYIAEKQPNWFLVRGTPNMKFAWEVKAHQRDYEYTWLEDPDAMKINTQQFDDAEKEFEKMYNETLDKLIKEQEEALHEAA